MEDRERFRCYIVKKEDKGQKELKPENFFEHKHVPSCFKEQDAWDRNHIVEIHVLALAVGRAFVANNAQELRVNMLPIQSNWSVNEDLKLTHRERLESTSHADLIDDGITFEQLLEAHAI
jgi:hypothetical protein